jgi:hypothetical protein
VSPAVDEQCDAERHELNDGESSLRKQTKRGIGEADRDGDRHERERRGDRHPLADPEVRLVVRIGADVENASYHAIPTDRFTTPCRLPCGAAC